MPAHRMEMCDAAIGVDTQSSGTPFVVKCPNRATKFYRGRGPFAFGLWLCDDHKDMGLPH